MAALLLTMHTYKIQTPKRQKDNSDVSSNGPANI